MFGEEGLPVENAKVWKCQSLEAWRQGKNSWCSYGNPVGFQTKLLMTKLQKSYVRSF